LEGVAAVPGEPLTPESETEDTEDIVAELVRSAILTITMTSYHGIEEIATQKAAARKVDVNKISKYMSDSAHPTFDGRGDDVIALSVKWDTFLYDLKQAFFYNDVDYAGTEHFSAGTVFAAVNAEPAVSPSDAARRLRYPLPQSASQVVFDCLRKFTRDTAAVHVNQYLADRDGGAALAFLDNLYKTGTEDGPCNITRIETELSTLRFAGVRDPMSKLERFSTLVRQKHDHYGIPTDEDGVKRRDKLHNQALFAACKTPEYMEFAKVNKSSLIEMSQSVVRDKLLTWYTEFIKGGTPHPVSAALQVTPHKADPAWDEQQYVAAAFNRPPMKPRVPLPMPKNGLPVPDDARLKYTCNLCHPIQTVPGVVPGKMHRVFQCHHLPTARKMLLSKIAPSTAAVVDMQEEDDDRTHPFEGLQQDDDPVSEGVGTVPTVAANTNVSTEYFPMIDEDFRSSHFDMGEDLYDRPFMANAAVPVRARITHKGSAISSEQIADQNKAVERFQQELIEHGTQYTDEYGVPITLYTRCKSLAMYLFLLVSLFSTYVAVTASSVMRKQTRASYASSACMLLVVALLCTSFPMGSAEIAQNDTKAMDLPAVYDGWNDFVSCVLLPRYATENATCTAVAAKFQQYTGMSDTGTTYHLTNNFDLLHNPRTVRNMTMTAASATSTVVTHVGDLDVHMQSETGLYHKIPPTTIFFCAEQPFTLFSHREFQKVGFSSPDYETLRYTRGAQVFPIKDNGASWNIDVFQHNPVSAATKAQSKQSIVHRDTSNWMFDKLELQKCKQDVLGEELTWHDMFTDGEGMFNGNSHEKAFWSKADDAFGHTFAGRNFIANPVYENDFIHRFFDKFWADAALDPANTKLIVILPDILGATWNHNISRMRLLKRYNAGSQIFSCRKEDVYKPEQCAPCSLDRGNNNRVHIVGTPWPVMVLYWDQHVPITPVDIDLYHARCGHLSHKYMAEQLQQNQTANFSGKLTANRVNRARAGCDCKVCRLAKCTQPVFKGKDPERYRHMAIFEQVHSDIKGPLLETPEGYLYMVHFTCARTGYTLWYPMRTKDELSQKFEHAYNRIQALGYTNKTLTLRSDAESVYLYGDMKSKCEQLKVCQEHSPPYLKQSAGLAENVWKQLSKINRCIVTTVDFPENQWHLSYSHATLLKNLAPSKPRRMNIPYREVHRKHFPMQVLRIFGSPCTYWMHPSQRNSGSDNPGREAQYVGHSQVSNAYKVRFTETDKVGTVGRIHVHEDLIGLGNTTAGIGIKHNQEYFIEDVEAASSVPPNYMTQQSLLQEMYSHSTGTVLQHRILLQESDSAPGATEAIAIIKVSTEAVSGTEPVWCNLSDFLYVTPFDETVSTEKWNAVDNYLNNVHQTGDPHQSYDPLFTTLSAKPGSRARKYHRAYVTSYDSSSSHRFGVVWHPTSRVQPMDIKPNDVQVEPGVVAAVHLYTAALRTSTPTDLANYTEPLNYKHATLFPDFSNWLEGIQVCFDNFKRLDAFSFEQPPEGVSPIGSKFVFKLKKVWNSVLLTWDIGTYRVRLVGLGYNQEYGVNYEGTFAPTAQLCTTRVVFNEAVQQNLYMYQLDVRSAFLNSEIEYDMWVRLPAGFQYEGHSVLKLKRTLEGTKQGAHDWYKTQNKFILAYDDRLQHHPADPCFYYIVTSNLTVYIVVHTDDYLVVTNSPTYYAQFYAAYNAKYPCTDQGAVTKFLGLNVDYDQNAGTLTLDQEGDILSAVTKYFPEEAHSKSSPIAVGTELPSDTTCDSTLSYRSLLGLLMWWARNTRPDIYYATQYHAQFCNCYTSTHFTSLKRVLLYLKGTSSYKLTYKRQAGKREVSISTDNDWGGNKLDRRSFMGSSIKINGNLIGWWCRKQKSVALSSMEAEYMGMCSASRNGMYIIHLLYHVAQNYLPIPIYVDNRAAELFSEKAMINEKTKHIDIAYHYVRQMIEKGFFKPVHINTNVNEADIFTKALASERLKWLTQGLLGLIIVNMIEYEKKFGK